MKNLIASILIYLSVGTVALAHGEEKPGPHGGEIRMPGAFHTELVRQANGAGAFQFYLLDMDWKNPVVENSTLKVTLKEGARETTLSCIAKKEFFECSLPKGSSATKSGELIVNATRQGAAGGQVMYRAFAAKHK